MNLFKKVIIFLSFILIVRIFFNTTSDNLVDTIVVNEVFDNCISNDNFIVTDELLEMSDELLNSDTSLNFIYTEINSDFSLTSGNIDDIYYGASIIKMPFAIYIYELAKSDTSILDIVLEYSNYYNIETVLENKTYTVRELVKYMVEDSDNVAFYMLYDEFDIESVQNFWFSLGADTTFVGWDPYGTIDLSDALIYMEYLSTLLLSNDVYYDELLSFFNNASKDSIVQDIFDEDLYFKYGYVSGIYHEIMVVDDINPYILIMLSTDDKENMIEIADQVSELHSLYWQEKINYCISFS